MPSPSPNASLLLRIRQAFCQCSGSVHSSISPVELARYWQKLAEGEAKRQGRVFTATDSQAIALGVVQLVQEVDLTSTGRFTIDDWVHYMLLLSSGRATCQVNSLLKSAVQRRPRVLHDLQSTFEQMGGAKKGMVNAKDVIEMYSHKLMKLISGSLELGNRDPEQFAHEVMDALSLDTDERITYHEFVAYCLGRQKHKVCLYLYDLSNGLSESVSPNLIGTKLDAIWHSGVVVFGKEYYFSRDTMFDEAGKTGFGTPTKILELGSTLWHQEELHHFICRELKPMFHRGTYDVVLNNCNHFSDRLCMYLLGQRLPDEVLRQSSYLMQSKTIRTLRPVLNWWVRDVVVQRETETTLQAEGQPPVDFSPGACVTMTKDCCRPVLGVVCHRCPDGSGEGNDEGTWVRYFNLCLGKAGSCRGHVCTEWVPLACLQEAQFSHYDRVYREILSAIVPDGSFELGAASLKETNVTSDNLTDTLDPDEWSVFPCEQSNVVWKSACDVKPHAEIFL